MDKLTEAGVLLKLLPDPVTVRGSAKGLFADEGSRDRIEEARSVERPGERALPG